MFATGHSPGGDHLTEEKGRGKEEERRTGRSFCNGDVFFIHSLSPPQKKKRRSSERGPFSVVAVVCSWSLGTDSRPTSLRMLNLMNSSLSWRQETFLPRDAVDSRLDPTYGLWKLAGNAPPLSYWTRVMHDDITMHLYVCIHNYYT